VLAARAILVLSLFAFVIAVLWCEREGIRDQVDGVLTFVDLVYFTVISLTTVGYGDIVPVTERARLVDALILTPTRLVVWLVFVGTAFELFFHKGLERIRMLRLQRQVTDHVILCGFGHSGRTAAAELVSRGTSADKLVVIDADDAPLQRAAEAGHIGPRGDATLRRTLRDAGIERAAGKLLPMVLASALGVAAMMLTGGLRWQEATDALSSKVVMVVVASLAPGEALMATGLIAAAGNGVAALGNWVPPAAKLTALMLLMAVVTNFVSNNAAAIIGTPIAIAMATTLEVDPRPFVLAVLFGCNICYATPMGYQTNLLVMSAVGYRFNDFMRAGLPLAILMWITLTWLLAKRYALL